MEQLKIIRTIAELKDLEISLKDKEFIALDTETTGVDADSMIIGVSVSVDVEEGIYIILSYWDVKDQRLVNLETTQYITTFLKSLFGKKLILQNAPFDCNMIERNYDVSLMPYVHTDTLVLAHLLDENRHNGLKELGVSLFGDDARKEQLEMKESVTRNGGVLTKDKYELYKADADLIARYGAKDAILTLKIFYQLIPELYEQGLDTFFYDEESMPLLRGPTYELNTSGLRVDPNKLQNLKGTLEAECMEAKAFIHKEIAQHVAKKYPGTKPTNTFNIGASKQLAWLLFSELGNEFNTLTKVGKEVCKALDMKLPYSAKAKREFLRVVKENKDRVYCEPVFNSKTRKMGRPKKVGDFWNYVGCGKESLLKLATRYKWVEKLLEYSKNLKLLNTYVEGIQSRMKYNIIRPSFLQHGTTSGRYSSRSPNFQNLPRDDKRIKACIVSREGKVFVGADYSQLEPRVFASFSGDERLLKCFSNGEDFYSVIGAEVFGKYNCSLKKDDDNSFAKQYPDLRQIAKVIALSATYGTTAPKMAPTIGMAIDQAQEVINKYFEDFPSVLELMLESHEQAKESGRVLNLFGRPRRMPKATEIKRIYGKTKHSELPYEVRNILNLAVNHRIQSTGASIVNRACIRFSKLIHELGIEECSIVMQIHDEVIVECKESDSLTVSVILKDALENTTKLPGVELTANPIIANNLADLK